MITEGVIVADVEGREKTLELSKVQGPRPLRGRKRRKMGEGGMSVEPRCERRRGESS